MEQKGMEQKFHCRGAPGLTTAHGERKDCSGDAEGAVSGTKKGFAKISQLGCVGQGGKDV